MTIADLQAGDVLIFERSSVVVTSVYRRPGGGFVYTLAGNRTCIEFPPSIMELPPGDVGELKMVMRPKLYATWASA